MNEEFKRLKKWVEMCPVEAAMRIEELEGKIEQLEKERWDLFKNKEMWIEGSIQQHKIIESYKDALNEIIGVSDMGYEVRKIAKEMLKRC
jgi:hypothetical protein